MYMYVSLIDFIGMLDLSVINLTIDSNALAFTRVYSGVRSKRVYSIAVKQVLIACIMPTLASPCSLYDVKEIAFE